MKILIAAGGSGGHIYPGQAIVQALKKLRPETEFIWVGTRYGQERQVAQEENIPYVAVRAWSINNEGLIWKLQAYWFHGLMTLKLMWLLKKEKVDGLVSTGGYATASSLMAARILKLPFFMHEQNLYPGLGTRMFGRFSRKVFTSFPGSEKYLEDARDRISLLGNPVREDFLSLDYHQAREELGLGDKLLVLSLGGSLGARSINDFVESLIPGIEAVEGLRWIHVVGSEYAEDVELFKNKNNIEAHVFLDDIPRYLAAADLLITRCGASTLTEISTLGKASVLIPSPNVLDDHQTLNARVFSDNEGGILLEDDRLDEAESRDLIFSLLKDENKRKELAKNSKGLTPRDSASKIAQEILENL